LGGKYYELNLEKYSARPITLSHDGILTIEFFVCKWWDAVGVDRGVARVSRATHARAIGEYFTVQIFFVSPLDLTVTTTRAQQDEATTFALEVWSSNFGRR
jgi:hypothetical protein